MVVTTRPTHTWEPREPPEITVKIRKLEVLRAHTEIKKHEPHCNVTHPIHKRRLSANTYLRTH